MLAEAGTHTKAAEQGLQVAKQTLGGLETSVQEVIPLSSTEPLVQWLLWSHCTPEVLDPL